VKIYKIKEIFPTIQGEGALAGTAMVFIRMSGCNAWTGKEQDRESDAVKKGSCALICDTDFVGMDKHNGGGAFTSERIKEAVESHVLQHGTRWAVLTGGEPMLQMDTELIDALWGAGVKVAVETNGSIPLADKFDGHWSWPDHICVSPKPPLPVRIEHVDELKVLVPLYSPEDFAGIDAKYNYVQAVWADEESTTQFNKSFAVKYVLRNPNWKLSTQTHKYLGLP